jgi:DNA-binding NarL/FixJ family response regulator
MSGRSGLSMAPELLRLYLLDDHHVVRRGLRDLFESEGDMVVVGESGSAVDAKHRIPALRPDVAVLDARLPEPLSSRRS